MKCFSRFVSFLLIATVSIGMALQPYAEAETYKWTDAQGNVHFTDDISRVPDAKRDAVEVVALPEPTNSYDAAAAQDSSLDTPSVSPTSMDADDVMAAPMGPDTQCLEAISEERERLEAQLAEDQERMAWIVKKRRYTTVRKNRALQKERAMLETRIQETQIKLSQELPQRERACGG